MFQSNWTWLAAYVLLLATILAAMFWARPRVTRTFSDAETLASWEKWREDAARQQEGEGPVHRRKPVSPEPPALVLFRDHFYTCLIGLLVLGSALFGFLMIVVRGVIHGPAPQIDYSDPQ